MPPMRTGCMANHRCRGLDTNCTPCSERSIRLKIICPLRGRSFGRRSRNRSEEHTSELQSRENLVCRLLLEKKNHKILDLRPDECLEQARREPMEVQQHSDPHD